MPLMGCTNRAERSYVFEETGRETKGERRNDEVYSPRRQSGRGSTGIDIYDVKASKVDRKFSYANLCRTIERSRVVANTAKKVMERTEIDGRKISEYLTAGGRTGRTGRTNQE